MNELNRYANTSRVEDYLYSALYGKVSDHVFIGTITEPKGDWEDMVLIDCDLPMTDYGPYSKATVYVFLYARPIPDGTKNAVRSIQMEDALCDVLESIQDEHYSVERLSNGADYDAQINWHRNFVYFNLIVTC